jgi:hypothetical protein
MIYSHLDNLIELEKKALILNGYDYTLDDSFVLIEKYFQFCQTNLSEVNKEYLIQPARFYIKNEPSVNAIATLRNDYYVIGVNIGTLITMRVFFAQSRFIFENSAVSDFKAIDGKLDTPLELLMYQVCTQFTYYHELAHLIQYSPLNKNSQSNKEKLHTGHEITTDEAYAMDAGTDDPYDLVKHTKEFDADLHGGYFICLHMIDYWKRLDISYQTPKNLELLLSLGIAAVFSYFIFLLRGYPNIYYEASDHPHPLIRILYIIDQFIKTSEKNLPVGIIVDPADILQHVFSITQAAFTIDGGEDRVRVFADIYNAESAKIVDYVNKVLMPQSRLMPELVLSRMSAKLDK